MSRRKKRQGRRRRDATQQPRAPRLPLTDEVAAQLTSWSQEACAAFGVEMWDLETSAQPRWVVRLYVDTTGPIGPGQGVTIETCADVSRYLETLLDADPRVPENYQLEVSSPGIERELKTPAHLERVIGQQVVLNLQGLPGVPNPLEGELVELEAGELVVARAGDRETLRVPWSAVGKARMAWDFSRPMAAVHDEDEEE